MVESTDPIESKLQKLFTKQVHNYNFFLLVLERVKASLNSRGVRTIRGMGRSFRIMDDNGDRKIQK